MANTILEENRKKAFEALQELYKLRDAQPYWYDSYCLPAVKMLQHLTRGMQ